MEVSCVLIGEVQNNSRKNCSVKYILNQENCLHFGHTLPSSKEKDIPFNESSCVRWPSYV
jgi:hypothetical protein